MILNCFNKKYFKIFSDRLVFQHVKKEGAEVLETSKEKLGKKEKFVKERQKAAEKVGKTLIEKAEEAREESEKLKYRTEIFVDPVTGFKIYSAVPGDYNGNVDMYFPGDGHSIKKSLKNKGLLKRAVEKWRTGDKSALVIVEGDKEHIKGSDKSKRYTKLRRRGGVFKKVVNNLERKIGSVDKIHIIGHSRGGSAINYILRRGGIEHKLSTLSLLDATYWNPGYLIDYAKRGGALNVVFQSHPKFLKKNSRPRQNAHKIIKALDLRKVDEGHWQSTDKKVNVYDAGKISHRAVAQRYVGKLMKGATEISPGRKPVLDKGPYRSQERIARVEIAKGLLSYLDKLNERNKSPEKLREFSKWANEQTEAELLRRANVSVKENRENFFEKHVRLGAEYVSLSSERLNGNTTFDVDFKGNELAEWNIGAGHILPPTVKAIRVYDESGNILHDYAERGIQNGRVGYFVPESGKYATVHTGYKIEVLEVQNVDHVETKERIVEELDFFDEEERRIAVKDALKEFFKEKNLNIIIDDRYFVGELRELMGNLPADWWEDYLDDAFVQEDFAKVFERSFDKEDLNLIENLQNLRNRGAYEEVYMSDFLKLRNNPKFEELRSEILDSKKLADFKKEKLEGYDFSDFLLESGEVLSEESFVHSTDHYGNRVILRVSAMKKFKRALEIAKSRGVRLKVVSSYRPVSRQAMLFKRAVKKYGSEEEADNWVARPGGSAHHTGGAIDVIAYYKGSGGRRHNNQKRYLKLIMSRAGFVNYRPEPWHWEIYTSRWRKITREQSQIYDKAHALNIKTLPSYSEYEEEIKEAVRSDVAEKFKKRGIEITSYGKEMSQLMEMAVKNVAKRKPEYFRPGKCEHNAGEVAEETLRLIFGEKPIVRVRRQSLDREATEKLRGVRASRLTVEHLAHLKPGDVIYFANPKKYRRKGISIRSGTSNKIRVVRNTDRHWVTWNGRYFVDNWGMKKSLEDLRKFVNYRVVVNVHDPYSEYRDRFAVVNGRLTIT